MYRYCTVLSTVPALLHLSRDGDGLDSKADPRLLPNVQELGRITSKLSLAFEINKLVAIIDFLSLKAS
jgi:hypothetical protein